VDQVVLVPHRRHGGLFDHPVLEYRADVERIARLAITRQESLLVFERYFLRGDRFREVCAALRIDRGAFWHLVYAVKRDVGCAWVWNGIYPYANYRGEASRPVIRALPHVREIRDTLRAAA
jgi:hypothetical protein